MVEIRVSAKSPNRRSPIGVSFPSPLWGEGWVRGESSNGDSDHALVGMTMMVNCERLFIRSVSIAR